MKYNVTIRRTASVEDEAARGRCAKMAAFDFVSHWMVFFPLNPHYAHQTNESQ